MEYGLLSAGQTKLHPCSMHLTPTDKTAGVSSRMYGVKSVCRASTVASVTSSARVEPLAVARQMGVSLTRRLVACAVCSIPSLMRSCSLPVSTSQTHLSFGADVATVGKWVLLTLLLGPMHDLHKLQVTLPSSSVQRKRHEGSGCLSKSLTTSWSWRATTWARWMTKGSVLGTISVLAWPFSYNRGRCTTFRCSPVAGTLKYSTFDENTTAR